MHFRITHRTSYRHSETVPLCQNALWLVPRESGFQKCDSYRLMVTPEPSSRSHRRDYFGNEVNYFTVDTGYRQLDITAISDVRLSISENASQLPGSPPWETVVESLSGDLSEQGIEACQFRFDSPYATAADEMAEYARVSFTRNRPVADAARELTSRIHQDFSYQPGTTTVQTPVNDAFAQRRGVCQDFAHVAIACVRSLGIPARYVSGYLRTIPPPGQPRLVGADASHAWFSVYCGEAGWIDFDPTNDTLPSTDHITLAWGRDYADVTPVRGLFVGGGRHEMEVSVDVAPIDEER